MTDNEIIKALECCKGYLTNDCAMCQNVEKYPRCNEFLNNIALDLINRQKADIERLLQKLQQAQSKAIKEFAERLKERGALFDSDDVDYLEDEGHLLGNTLVKLYVSEKTINNLVKEMAGDTK